ncbi:hypothetical protein OH76DRAFT_1489257 [Lentinus brumalis]|uniref:Uncharacterized protein n=1 Tax=Lentinus brumalis TaxID=2498619 RepID=A0A371CN85_9APHY|nr:hypothetical protein OH76DRAFT_1489257 [Polyporus brumalis]
MLQASTKDVQEFAQKLTEELNTAATSGKIQEFISGLKKIIEATVWTKAFDSTERDTYHSRIREDGIREIEARWWHTEPVPENTGRRISLEFCDLTAQHKTWRVEEVWAPETVECASFEAFARAAQRFRVQADRKYRHPFVPSTGFDALLKSGRTSFDSLASRFIADIVADLSDVGVVPYIRNDEANQGQESPWKEFPAWERTLPAWCSTPNHWIEPIPPPGFADSQGPHPLREQYYKKVPTLFIPGNGRCIVSCAKKPDVISRALFIPVHEIRYPGTVKAILNQEADLVPYGAHFVPGKVTLDAAQALLGRVIQSSTEPRSDPDEFPAGKRRKVNKSVQTEQYGDSRDPLAVLAVPCAWVGAAVLPADVKALEIAAGMISEGMNASVGKPEAEDRLSSSDWSDKTMACIRKLNADGFDPVVEVGPDGMFVGGDLGTSKGDDDEFEAEITGAQPGVWSMSVEPAEGEEADEDRLMHLDPLLIRFVWASDGSVDYDALPRPGSIQAQSSGDPHATWEVVGSFSVDSGTVCLFSKYALDNLLSTGKEDDREAMLEAFFDDGGEGNVFVPSGVVTASSSDGGFEVEGRRDEDGQIVELRLRV